MPSDMRYSSDKVYKLFVKNKNRTKMAKYDNKFQTEVTKIVLDQARLKVDSTAEYFKICDRRLEHEK